MEWKFRSPFGTESYNYKNLYNMLVIILEKPSRLYKSMPCVLVVGLRSQRPPPNSSKYAVSPVTSNTYYTINRIVKCIIYYV